MGLDINAYKGLRKVENPKFDSDGELENWEIQWLPGASMKWSESVWPGKGKPIDADTVYEYEDCFEFRAGSYSGYNRWRDDLEKFKGDVAFQELIDFADNEGVIGSELSAKLRDDFKKYHDEAMEFAKREDVCMHFFESYCNWEKAFAMAAENGAVEFC